MINKCKCDKCNCSYSKSNDKILCASCDIGKHMNFMKRFELWIWRQQNSSALDELDTMILYFKNKDKIHQLLPKVFSTSGGRGKLE